MGNETPDTPGPSETELRDTKVDDLREQARDAGISGRSDMKKEELVEALSEAAQDEDGGRGGEAGLPGDRGPDDGHLRTGDQTSSSLKYSQEITSTGDRPERAGRSLVTTDHEVIRQWARSRKAVPATVPGTEHGDHLGVLRFDFPGYSGDTLTEVSWEQWLDTFDKRRLNFVYQEQRSDGNQSNFFILESPDREDA